MGRMLWDGLWKRDDERKAPRLLTLGMDLVDMALGRGGSGRILCVCVCVCVRVCDCALAQLLCQCASAGWLGLCAGLTKHGPNTKGIFGTPSNGHLQSLSR